MGHGLIFEGRPAEASGWITRARQLLAGPDIDCPEQGYVMVIDGVLQIEADPAAARATFAAAQAIGRRFGDADLVAMAGHGRGRACIRCGEVGEGMAALDEVMAAIAADDVSAVIVGDVYCGVLEACKEVFDIQRAQEWTGALSRWCAGQPDLVPHRGPCQVYRAELLQLRGEWVEALSEAQRACEWLSSPANPEGAADAYYRLGEIHRLRGEYGEAEAAYRQATRLGRQPEPGLPLLWLARGQVDAARTALRRALDEESAPGARALLLHAVVETAIEANDTKDARVAADQLANVAADLDVPLVRALAATAEGAIALAEGSAQAALRPLRAAWRDWQRLEAPYEAARVRTLIGCAYRDVGDEESAMMEFDAARWVFEGLAAGPDLARVARLASRGSDPASAGLTGREREVLALIAAGRTNKEIGVALVISEHTVARHVQNMLAKLGCASRAALAAFAAEHGLATAGHTKD
jgi:DNA-binding CsgD family transcriptional regulator